MSDDFKVGEILIFQHGTSIPERNETECELIGGWDLRPCGVIDHEAKQIKTVEMQCYRIKFADGQIFNCQRHQLRRKKPPKEDINTKVSWENCLWSPHKIPEKA